jgi:hypothetical protein
MTQRRADAIEMLGEPDESQPRASGDSSRAEPGRLAGRPFDVLVTIMLDFGIR